MSALGGWLLDTLIATSGLMLLVLALRGVVSRNFGPQMAYGLWVLPMLRLLLPPLVLPASMAPLAEPGARMADIALAMEGTPTPLPAASLPEFQPESTIGAGEVLLAIWLAGAFLLLCWRAAQYRLLRRAILAGARPVGETGSTRWSQVRLVEAPGATMPLAFGIFDKVVALPPGFMGHHDLAARDLAIAHELAHHRGHDLLANLVAQALLAMHWFNPIAWAGWRAMRKDQEAACDARVVAGRTWDERIIYAQVIAGFAAGRPLARHASLACPILGEKSIIHRLRSLSMSEHSPARRRMGLAITFGAVLALPLTASISYAQPDPPAATRIKPDTARWHTVESQSGRRIVLTSDLAIGSEEAKEDIEAREPVTGEEAPSEAPPAPHAPPQPPIAQAPPAPPAAPARERRVVVRDLSDDNGTVEVRTLCQSDGSDCTVDITAQTIVALEHARDTIRQSDIAADLREEVLRELEREIAEMRSKKAVSWREHGGAQYWGRQEPAFAAVVQRVSFSLQPTSQPGVWSFMWAAELRAQPLGHPEETSLAPRIS